jgi:predicted ribosome quality control (RQC) complex YloA/Tae2 family protein
VSLNWREIALIAEELPLTGSAIQGVVQHTFNALSWQLYHREVGRWTLYTEIGTPHSRLHMLTVPRTDKLPKLQRFAQFARSRLVGTRITEVYQAPYDRLLRLRLESRESAMYLYLRFYSGSGANILVTDADKTLIDSLFRRPRRGEISGELFDPGVERSEEGTPYPVRERTATTFNRQIEEEYGVLSGEASLSDLLVRVENAWQRELDRLNATVASLRRTQRESGEYEHLKRIADLLSANAHLLVDGATSIEVQDWQDNTTLLIPLDPKRKARENILASYDRYRKAKGAWERSSEEIERLEAQREERTAQMNALLAPREDHGQWLELLRRELKGDGKPVQKKKTPGLTITTGGFTLLVGRNATENDELLRHHTRGNDWWIHTRDYSGGYVFIKYISGKSVPLPVLLDAGMLAIAFSKGRKEGRAELYYTQVKYLRRAKGGKRGLVIPTQEKNLSVTLDEERLRWLLLTHEDA